jgi:hypothetical protein
VYKTIFLPRRDPTLSPEECRAYRLERHFTASHDHVVVEEHVAEIAGSAAA